jgi:F-box and WD-40 domain protein 1/11
MSDDDDGPRRQRIGSLSSAADSGADLSTYSGSEMSLRDHDGDIDMDLDSPIIAPQSSNSYDFVKQGILPYELVLEVFEYLGAEDLLNAERVNKAWYQIASKASVWRTVFLTKYGRKVYTDPPPIQVGGLGIGRADRRPNQQWRKMYKARERLDNNWRRGAENAGKAVYLSGHTDSVYCLQFDEEKIITGSRDRTIRVWDINTYTCIKVIGGPTVRPILGPKVLRTVDYPSFHMATASVNGTAYGNEIYHVPREWHDASILCLQYDSKILVTGSSDSDLLIWDIATYEPIKRLRKHTGGVLDVALDAKHIVSCSKDSRIIVWDRETLEAKGDLTGHRGPVNAVQLRGNYLVSASGDGVARLWDLTQMKLIKEFSPKERGLAAVEFSEDMRYVLAGGNDNITYKFDTQTGAEVMQFTGHSQLVRSLWLDSANNRVVSGSYDLDLRVYDFVTGEELWRGEEWTTSWMLAAKSDYRRIVATSQDGRILLVDFGILKGAPIYNSCDGMPIDNIDLLRGPEETTAIQFRNPWEPESRSLRC